MNFVFPVLQGVHVGNTSEETEKKKETKHADLHQESQSIQKQKSHYPVKQTVAPREKSDQDGKILNRVKPAGWTCNECLQQFTERDAYVSHLKTTHGKVRVH